MDKLYKGQGKEYIKRLDLGQIRRMPDSNILYLFEALDKGKSPYNINTIFQKRHFIINEYHKQQDYVISLIKASYKETRHNPL